MKKLIIALFSVMTASAVHGNGIDKWQADSGMDFSRLGDKTTLTEVQPAVPAVPTTADLTEERLPAAKSLLTVWGKFKEGDPAIQSILPKAKNTILANKSREGFFGQKKFITYVLKVSKSDLSDFQTAGFAPLEAIAIKMTWSRISNINGWGTEVNGECHRRLTGDMTFSGKDLDTGFRLMQNFVKDPLTVLKEQSDYLYVFASDAGISFERGFVIISNIEIRTGQVYTNDEQILFGYSAESGYYQ